MKLTLIVNKKGEISSKYRNADQLLTLDDGNESYETITAKNGKNLAQRINEIMPDALIINWAGPAIRFVDKNIDIYQANEGEKFKDVLDLYNNSKLPKYQNPHPPHTCGCAGCTNCNP